MIRVVYVASECVCLCSSFVIIVRSRISVASKEYVATNFSWRINERRLVSLSSMSSLFPVTQRYVDPHSHVHRVHAEVESLDF